jgi:hypothetical protein
LKIQIQSKSNRMKSKFESNRIKLQISNFDII